MAAEGGRVQISFPQHAAALLESLNRLRLEGKFCDVAVHVGGRVFPAHKSVLAAASPFFHDKLLLQDGGRLLLPAAIDPDAFEGLLHLIYSGRLTLLLEALPGHLLVASGLQMWHVVDQCSAVLRELEGGGCRWGGRGDAAASVGGRGGGGGGDGAALPSLSGCGGADRAVLPTGGRGGGDGAALPAVNGRGGDGAASLAMNGRGGDGAALLAVNGRGGDGAPSLTMNGRGGDGAALLAVNGRSVDGAALPAVNGRGGDGAAPPLWSARGDGAALSVPVWPPGGADGAFRKEGGEAEVLKVCVEDEDEEEDEAERPRRGDGALRAALEEDDEEEEDEEGAAPLPAAPAVLYIKQEGSEPAGAAGFVAVDAYGGGFDAAEVSYVVPGAAQPAWKPVDLHGNEILAQAAHGRALHAPVKLCAAPDGKRFGCLCGKRFAVKPKRDRHIMLTFSLRPFACSACHKRFKLKHHLTEHMKTHDGAARACERCGRSFRLRSGLAKHRGQCQGQRWAAPCWACE
ncbi:zinc finger and BTB domain-containing protein 9-like isoform X2 [Gallus gallus]|nr:zinc finger and BTB domain-containing protein 9-like isoform X2 [Gallus gallus]XP_040550308.1 zinc finger and BTB domain-containing protein 9-like isoform X2 [Gallus gallus]